MTFSLRSILIVTAVIALWLGAILSQSLLAVELATLATNAGLFLALAIAIWHRQPEQRAFWTGFCALGLGNLILASYFSAYMQTSLRIAEALVGQQQPGWMTYPAPAPYGYSPTTYQTTGSGMVTYLQPPMTSGWGPAVSVPVNNYNQYEAIRLSVAPLFTLLLAGLGGWVTLWVSRSPRKDSESVPSHS